MKWNPMETAPRDGTLVLLLYHDFSGVVAARFGERNCSHCRDSGWFYADWSEEIGPTDESLLVNYDVTDKVFAGWFQIPELQKEAVPAGATCQSAEHAIPETTTNDAQRD
jgi:hypothetical protein